MTNGGTVEELDAQVDALVLAVVKHNQVIQDAEQQSVAHPDDAQWPAVVAVHREIVDEHIVEIRLLRAEIALLPRPRRPVD
jgi:hypothetical protein